jgi:hypothetical protein
MAAAAGRQRGTARRAGAMDGDDVAAVEAASSDFRPSGATHTATCATSPGSWSRPPSRSTTPSAPPALRSWSSSAPASTGARGAWTSSATSSSSRWTTPTRNATSAPASRGSPPHRRTSGSCRSTSRATRSTTRSRRPATMPRARRCGSGFVVGRLGEPLRSVFRPAEMAALLVEHGFAVVRDDGIPAISATLSDDRGARSRFTSHFRGATADR